MLLVTAWAGVSNQNDGTHRLGFRLSESHQRDDLMDTIKDALVAFHEDEDGATATEYIILLILVACFVIAIVKLFGSTVSEKYGKAQKGVKKSVKF